MKGKGDAEEEVAYSNKQKKNGEKIRNRRKKMGVLKGGNVNKQKSLGICDKPVNLHGETCTVYLTPPLFPVNKFLKHFL